MSKLAIRVEVLGKEYRLGEPRGRYTTLRDRVNKLASAPLKAMRGLGERSEQRPPFWALRDVSFEVRPGEVVGIIGRNGAGKSTLLKILSRITEPTEGEVDINGRVGSLLEVGTGFHPELTGRENVYLNGAILGMRRSEIVRKFDEIVAFAEVEKFIDTPVKHYSSGMYMRLAFAVAAHLEPEILVVDEVLAVGDAAFQNKCLGRMSDISKQGRTILFVSHNMAAIRSLCGRAVLLDAGRVALDAGTDEVVEGYFSNGDEVDNTVEWAEGRRPEGGGVSFCRAYLVDADGRTLSSLEFQEPFSLVLEYEVRSSVRGLRTAFMLTNAEGTVICGSTSYGVWTDAPQSPGRYRSVCTFPCYLLNSGTYHFTLAADMPPFIDPSVYVENCLSLTVVDHEGHGPSRNRLIGVVRPKLCWEIERAD